ncbi:MAG TPA: hypothetical protein PKW32_13735 [Verrucomicrobiota bacterium]|nr:hypothetical protein [Verrucomicrobiota bacterium]
MKDPRPKRSAIRRLALAAAVLLPAMQSLEGGAPPAAGPADPAAADETLRAEVAGLGWILFAARTGAGDYDLFACRPDGSARRNLTQSPAWSEYGARLSPDGKQLLYRRLPKGPDVRPGEGINHDLWGAQGSLVIARADGSQPQPHGAFGAWPWASWGPDSRQIACLYKSEGRIRILDLAAKSLVRELPRHGIFQQMYWSPDGRRICGTANIQGQDWNIVGIDLDTGRPTLLSRGQNCTGDWFQNDSTRVIYSHRTPGLGSSYGWTMLMQATADGKSRSLVYAERGRHVYYGGTSPDGRYALFSIPETDGGTDAPMAIVRLADAPVIVPPDYRELRSLHPEARTGPVLRLPHAGFEPHWTFEEAIGR